MNKVIDARHEGIKFAIEVISEVRRKFQRNGFTYPEGNDPFIACFNALGILIYPDWKYIE